VPIAEAQARLFFSAGFLREMKSENLRDRPLKRRSTLSYSQVRISRAGKKPSRGAREKEVRPGRTGGAAREL